MSIRLGVIGVGTIGAIHLKAARDADVAVACIADVLGDHAQQRAEEFDIANAVDDPDKLLGRDDVDAVVIAVPNKFHAPLAIAALQAGKDVLIEKPMALTAQQCAQINKTARQHQRLVQVGFVHRYTAVARVAKALIEADRIGRIYHIKASMYRNRGIPGLGGWFTTKALSGGGPLIDLGVHVIDLALHLAGYPLVDRVSGKTFAQFGPRMENYVFENMWAGPPKLEGVFDVEDAAHALLRLQDGATMELNVTWAGNFPDNAMPSQVVLMGERGGLTFSLNSDKLTLTTEQDGYNVDVLPKFAFTPGFDEAFKLQLQTFIGHVESRTTPDADGEAGRIVSAVIDAIYASSEQNCEVAL